jgi:hypothetical protein
VEVGQGVTLVALEMMYQNYLTPSSAEVGSVLLVVAEVLLLSF